jgi:hypothetical protein
VVAIAGGKFHSLALKADGSVIAWGNNDYGQTNVPASVNILTNGITVGGMVDANSPGSYTLTYTPTNSFWSLSTNRTVVVVDTTAPVLTLLGDNPLIWPLGTAWSDPGATAIDTCGGDFTSSITVTGSVTVDVLGTNILTYSVADSYGNASTANRTVLVCATPSISSLSSTCAATNSITGTRSATFSATVNPNGLASGAWFEYGLTTNYSANGSFTNLAASYTDTSLPQSLDGLAPGCACHWRVVATNALGATTSADQTLSVPAIYATGDLNGDGTVSSSELAAVISNYWASSTNYIDGLTSVGKGQFTFGITNSAGLSFTILASTNLTNWSVLTNASPEFLFTDSAATNAPQRYYRLRWP